MEANDIDEAIILLERWSRKFHDQQRLDAIENMSVSDKVSRMIRDANRAFSSPSANREAVIARSVTDMIRNASLKSQLVGFLTLEGLLERLAIINTSLGIIDEYSIDPGHIEELTPKERITWQASLHKQQHDILQRLDEVKFDGISTLVTALNPQNEVEIKESLNSLGDLKTTEKDKVEKLFQAIVNAIDKKSKLEDKVHQTLEITDKE